MLNICIFTIAVGCIIYMHIIYTNEIWNTYCIYNCTVTLHWQQILFYVYIHIIIYTSYHTQVKHVDTDIKHQPWNLTSLERRIKKKLWNFPISNTLRSPNLWELLKVQFVFSVSSCANSLREMWENIWEKKHMPKNAGFTTRKLL